MNEIFDMANLPENIAEAIRTDVQPSLQMHGGDLKVTEFRDGVLHFRLVGACQGCPSAWLTAEELVKAPLMEKCPELKDVVVDTSVSDELIQMARDILSQRHKQD